MRQQWGDDDKDDDTYDNKDDIMMILMQEMRQDETWRLMIGTAKRASEPRRSWC